MSGGAYKLLSEILPNFKSAISDHQEMRGICHKNISRIEENDKAKTYNRNNIPVDSVDNDIQRKHHSVMEEIKSKGRYNHGEYIIGGSHQDEIIEQHEELIISINEEIKHMRKKRAGFIAVILGSIVLPIVISVI